MNAIKERGKNLLTGFVGTTEDISEAYLYLARAKYTTGTGKKDNIFALKVVLLCFDRVLCLIY